jgi:hypothetical protein
MLFSLGVNGEILRLAAQDDVLQIPSIPFHDYGFQVLAVAAA